MKDNIWILYAFALICFGFAFVFGITLLVNRKKLRTTKATILDASDTVTDKVPWNAKRATLRYRIDGTEYLSERRYTLPSYSAAGDEIKVKYVAGHPEKLYIDQTKKFIGFLTAGILFALLAFFVG